MNEEDRAKTFLLKHIEDLEELLESALPDVDKHHKDEILDICMLLRQRTETYANEYGVNEDAVK